MYTTFIQDDGIQAKIDIQAIGKANNNTLSFFIWKYCDPERNKVRFACDEHQWRQYSDTEWYERDLSDEDKFVTKTRDQPGPGWGDERPWERDSWGTC